MVVNKVRAVVGRWAGGERERSATFGGAMRGFLALGLIATATAQTQPSPPGPLPETRESSIGFRSVGEALTALKAKSEVEILERDGWVLVQDRESEESMALWSFAPLSHPAYPSVVKRRVFERDGNMQVEMNVLCEAKKEECDQLVREFQELTDQMKQRFNGAR